MSTRQADLVAGAGDVRRPATYAVVLRHREFAALLGARILSDWGDYVARIALAALVLRDTGSALLSAAVFGVSTLPSVFGQALLAPYADRLPRRTLLVVCDLLRALLVTGVVAGVAVGASPWLLLGVVFVVELVGSPFFAANQALLVDVFDDRRHFLKANGLLRMVGQLDQVLGLAVGGVLVAVLSITGALWLDVASFVVSAGLLSAFVRHRAAAVGEERARTGLLADVRAGVRHLRGDVCLRRLMLLAWGMTVTFVAPEAVALPYAAAHGGGTRAGGLLLAAVPLGAGLGVALVGRWTPIRQVRRILPLAALAGLPLLVLAAAPPWPVAALLFVLSGLCQGFMVTLMSTFTVLAPREMRGRLNGLAGAGFALATALAFPAVGALADATSPALAVTVGGAAGCLVVAACWGRWPHLAIERETRRGYDG